MDLILGSFADAEIANLTDAEIDQYEQLLEISDTVLLPQVTGEAPVSQDDAILNRILAFRRSMTF
jgi:antitoxin CptB